MKRVIKHLVSGITFGLLLSLTGCSVQVPQSLDQTLNKTKDYANTLLSEVNQNKSQSNQETSTSQSAEDRQKAQQTQNQSSSTQKSASQSSASKTNSAKSAQTSSSVNQSDSQADTSSESSSSNSVVSNIEQHLKNQDQQFTVTTIGSGNIGNLFKEAMSQDPYIHWIISSYDISSNALVAKFTVDYRESKQQTDYVNTHVQQIVNDITKPGMANVYKEYIIHNWIVGHLQYDTSLKIDTAYDALNSGSAVCQGYALLAYKMLSAAGIPTKIETGTAGGQSHMWNEVKLNGNWYQFDATWDDPVGDTPSDIDYTYFNVTNQELAQTHQWKSTSFPVANTDFVSQLKALEKRDSQHASQYERILGAIGANLPVADSPQAAHQLIQQALQKKKSGIDLIIKSTQSSSTRFMKQANQNLVTTRSVSLRYTVSDYMRKGPGYSIVHLTFNY